MEENDIPFKITSADGSDLSAEESFELSWVSPESLTVAANAIYFHSILTFNNIDIEE